MTLSIEIVKPDDFHVHFREGELMKHFVEVFAKHFARGVAMPNLKVPVISGKLAADYLDKLRSAASFTPIMTIYLTKDTTQDMICAAADAGVVAVKVYPLAGTTNSGHGIMPKDLVKMRDVFRAMEVCDMLLLIHGEDPTLPMLQREVGFIKYITRIARDFPRLKIVFEHITTYDAVKVVKEYKNIAATITAHHLVLTTNDVLGNHDCLCMPVAKSESDRKQLAIAAMSGHPRFFYGSDSAPHPRTSKNKAQGAFGIYMPNGLEVLAQSFDEAGKRKKLNDFVSKFGAEWYGLPQNKERIELCKEYWGVPDPTEGEHDPATTVRPFMAGKTLSWKVRTD